MILSAAGFDYRKAVATAAKSGVLDSGDSISSKISAISTEVEKLNKTGKINEGKKLTSQYAQNKLFVDIYESLLKSYDKDSIAYEFLNEPKIKAEMNKHKTYSFSVNVGEGNKFQAYASEILKTASLFNSKLPSSLHEQYKNNKKATALLEKAKKEILSGFYDKSFSKAMYANTDAVKNPEKFIDAIGDSGQELVSKNKSLISQYESKIPTTKSLIEKVLKSHLESDRIPSIFFEAFIR